MIGNISLNTVHIVSMHIVPLYIQLLVIHYYIYLITFWNFLCYFTLNTVNVYLYDCEHQTDSGN